MAKEKRAEEPKGLQAVFKQHHPTSPLSAPGPGRQPAVEGGYREGMPISLGHVHSQDGAEVLLQGPHAQVLTLWLGRSPYGCVRMSDGFNIPLGVHVCVYLGGLAIFEGVHGHGPCVCMY